MEIYVEKTKAMTISRRPFPVWIMIDQKQTQNVEYFIDLSSMITNDAKHTREIKSRIAMHRQHSRRRKKKTLFTSKIRNKLVKCYIWSIALYCAATWTLQKVSQKYPKSFEMCWRRTEISCTDHVKNE
jgi:hypothetical protein